MPGLPVHSSADIHLADAFDAPGCPLCRECDRAETDSLEAILAEGVNDVPFRQTLDVARGFCGSHAGAILDADRARSGSLGAAILMRATLAPRLRELEAAHDAGERSRAKRVAEAARPPACPICARLARTESGLVDGLIRLAEEPAWAEAVSAAPFCLDHWVALSARRPPTRRSSGSAWAAIEERQLGRLHDLRDRLDAFAHASSHDRRHTITDAQREAVDEVAALLAGRARRPRDQRRHLEGD